MNKLLLAAALLMATTSAHASNAISFQIGGQKVRIEAPKHCDSLSCIQISAPGLSGSGFNLNGFKSKHDDVAVDTTPAAPAPAPAPAVQAAAPQTTAPVATTSAPAASTVVASTDSRPGVGFGAPAPVTAAPAPVAAAPAPTSTTPLGIWATEENKGDVRVEQCGQNLCGYAVKTGEKILINMKPQDSKWTGQIHDPDSGKNYGSTIAMKGPNAMRVEGCAFGGMFCGGQTWKRVG